VEIKSLIVFKLKSKQEKKSPVKPGSFLFRRGLCNFLLSHSDPDIGREKNLQIAISICDREILHSVQDDS